MGITRTDESDELADPNHVAEVVDAELEGGTLVTDLDLRMRGEVDAVKDLVRRSVMPLGDKPTPGSVTRMKRLVADRDTTGEA